MMKRDEPGKIANIAPFGLRLQPDLKRQVEEAAKANGRSLNAEITHRLETSFRHEASQSTCGVDQVGALEALQAQVRVLESKVNAIPADQLEKFAELMHGLKRGEIVILSQDKE